MNKKKIRNLKKQYEEYSYCMCTKYKMCTAHKDLLKAKRKRSIRKSPIIKVGMEYKK